jgi:bifunctional DNA-binding transcriptional regulator/antitoxin component of YhaV-PrlF toxin-antitoxin module
MTIPHEVREACGIEVGAELLFMRVGPMASPVVSARPRPITNIVAEHAMEDIVPDICRLQMDERG